MIKIFVFIFILFFNIVYGFYYPDIENCGKNLCNWGNKCDEGYECIMCKIPDKIPNKNSTILTLTPRCTGKGLFENTERLSTGY